MGKVKAWTNGEAGEPSYPDDFEIVTKAVLQVTDIKTNRNKYYAIELHSSSKGYRVFTHYGRTDDLETNPNAGQKECRYFTSLAEAEAEYKAIYKQKTSAAKGYKEISLASSKIGSQKARGTSAGEIDAKTIQKLADQKSAAGEAPPVVKRSTLHPTVLELVDYIYGEATSALTTTVAAKITAKGIETPLGILTIGQVEKGEAILQELYGIFKSGKPSQNDVIRLSGDFYTCIPHRIGRSRAAIEGAVIDTLDGFHQKQEILQLMKDMIQVNGESGSVLFDTETDKKYEALKCEIAAVDRQNPTYREIEQYVLGSQVKSKSIKIQRIYTLKRDNEWNNFTANIGNQRLLFHGSRIKNWVGILSRGILLPKIVVSLGVNRTDAGWLGNGIYFGDAACTSSFYTTPGKKGTRFMALARVGLGKMKEYRKITYGISEPPPGFDSCHGVRNKAGTPSEFSDDEYVIYRAQQQRLEYLVEFAA
jgi:poly [ADP-ribose] polymerase 2/3/4